MPNESGADSATPAGRPLNSGERSDERSALLDRVAEQLLRLRAELGREELAPRVRAALEAVPRHRFVPEQAAGLAYQNIPLPIGHGQTISQPFVVAVMTELLDLSPADRVLEIGTGCGYQTAILAELAERVNSIELIPELAERARERLAALGYAGVELLVLVRKDVQGALHWREIFPVGFVPLRSAAPDSTT